MVTLRKLLFVSLSLTLFALPRPFGLPQAEGQDKRTAKLIEGSKKEKEVVVWHIDDIDDDVVRHAAAASKVAAAAKRCDRSLSHRLTDPVVGLTR